MRELANSVLREIATLLRHGLPTTTLHSPRLLWSRWAMVVALMFAGALTVNVVTERLGFARQMIYMGAASNGVGWRDWIMACLLAPVMEELIFRSGLRYALMAILTVWGVALLFAWNSAWRGPLLGVWVVLSVVALLPLLKRRRRKKLLPRIDRILVRHRVLWVHLSTVAFAAIHLFNWRGMSGLPVGAVALVMPQLLVGYGLAYLCIRMGLRWSMLAHAAFNGFALGLASLAE
ncbi:MAG: CPBP family glutamic-type intramembrane protease [Pseudomonadota bacterium]